jgi:hypothetical protein
MCLNDFDFSDSSGRKIAYFRRPWLFLPQDVERRYRSLRGIEFHHWHFEKNRSEVFRVLIEMRNILSARGTGLLLAVMPVFPEKGEDPAYFTRYPFRDLHGEILGFARQNGFRIVDLLESFRRQPQPPERLSFDVWHLTVEGHAVAAASLSSALQGTRREGSGAAGPHARR